MTTEKWTAEQLDAEWAYRLHERIGIMCGDAEATDEQFSIAVQEADAAIEALKSE